MTPSVLIQCIKCQTDFNNKLDLANHLRASPDCKVGSNTHCSTCRVLFPNHQELKNHLYNNRSCKTTPKSQQNGNRFLLKTVEKESINSHQRSGLESAILSLVAEGDNELVTAYSRLADATTAAGKKNLSMEFVQMATRKAKFDLDQTLASENISICFVMETSGSMGSYVSGVQKQIVEIVNQVQAGGCCIAGLAFVGYKDSCDVLTFTEDVSSFQGFLSSIRASGGGTTSASVIGGLNHAVSLNWPEKSGSWILFHLGGASPQGKKGVTDGHSRYKPLENLFRDIRKKKLKYFIGRINNKEGEKMVRIFENYYGAKIDSLDTSKASLISCSVMASFISTISATFSRASSNSNPRHYVLDDKEPDWSKVPQHSATILSSALPKTFKEITSFAEIGKKVKQCHLKIASDPFGFESSRLTNYGKIIHLVKDSSNPETFLSVSTDVIFKEIISLPTTAHLDRHRYAINLEIQTIASRIALKFNYELSKTPSDPNIKIKYLRTKVARMLMDNGEQRFFGYEKQLRLPLRSASHRLCAFFPQRLEIIKYTNNLDYVIDQETLDPDGRKKLELALAFSHFSYHLTGGYLLVCDLQGISTSDGKGEPILLFTDPAIHCSKHLPRFGKSNLGAIGVNKFFNKHVCNQYCSALGLEMPQIY